MSQGAPPIPVEPAIERIAGAIAARGGRAVVVGGYVRDALLGQHPKDLDIEVYDLPLEALEEVLGRFGQVLTVGRFFGVLRVKGIDVDFSLPRSDSKVSAGHRGFVVQFDPSLDFASAARRRDLTINSIGYDPIRRELLDPHHGARDLEARVLRATDPTRFAEDPLRGLRVAQLAARLEAEPDPELVRLCAALDLSELSAERVLGEMRKLLLKGRRPSVGLRLLQQTDLLRFFPALRALVGVPQDPGWHPEGDVWVHTLMVVDRAAALRDGGADDEALMFGALCHDLGKPATTEVQEGRVRSLGHDAAGVEIAVALLEAMRAPKDLVAKVGVLVRHHLAPALYVHDGATARGYRRLARKLDAAGVSVELLVRVARADHLGRTTAEALAGVFPAGDTFLAQARQLLVEQRGPKDVVLGRHLIGRGLEPGPEFAEVLARCRDIQDETGWTDADAILDRAGVPRR